MQLVSITTKIESLNPVHGDMYSIQHYVIKFLNDLLGTPISFTYKTDRHDITDILLKVELKHQKSNQIKSRQVYRGNRRKITEDTKRGNQPS